MHRHNPYPRGVYAVTISTPSPTRVLAGLLLLLAGGCQPSGGYKITPVPADRSLDESVVLDEGGWVPPKVALIDLDGILINAKRGGLLTEGENPVSLTVEQLDQAAGDRQVKAVLLRLNSPGGSVGASDAIYQEVRGFRQRTGKPVVAMMMDVAASGAYYIACGCDEIVAQRTTITGSIGVVMQTFDVSGTMAKLGIHSDAIVSGPKKDAGSPLRPMTPEERRVFQDLVDTFYAQFLEVVRTGRPKLAELDDAALRTIADGRVYHADKALELGLIDRIGTIREAVAAAKQRAQLDRVRVVSYHRPLGWKPNLYAAAPPAGPTINLLKVDWPAWLRPAPQFLYLWTP